MSSGDDFHARFLLQICQIRDCVVPLEERQKYDKSYHPIHQNLTEAKFVKEQCETLIAKHTETIKSGLDGKYHGHQIDIINPIDDQLNIFFKDFFIRGAIACNSLISHTRYLGYNVGFLFAENEKKYRQGLINFPLKQDDDRFKILSQMISGHKSAWYVQFRDLRDAIEHQGWALPAIHYRLNEEGKVEIILPSFGTQTLLEILMICWENLTNFCEEILVYVMSLQLKDDQMMVQIKPEHREPILPVRYAVRHRDFPEAKYSCG